METGNSRQRNSEPFAPRRVGQRWEATRAPTGALQTAGGRVGRQARPACSPCGSKPISDKSQGVWGTASPSLIPSSHVRPHSESIPSFTLKNSPSITALTLKLASIHRVSYSRTAARDPDADIRDIGGYMHS